MVKIVEVKSNAGYVEIRMDNGTIFTVCPHDDYMYLTLSGTELPTHVNGDPEFKSNNTLSWEYRATRCGT